MTEYWKSTGPAGFGSHTERQPTLLLLVQNDGGYAITYGCRKVIIDGNIRTEIYYSPQEVLELLEGERKMTAKEMFEELGYVQTMNIDGLIEYIDYYHNEIGYIYIRFDLFWKSYEVGYFDCETKTEKAVVATTAEHKAIMQQVKELGWI